MLSDKYTEPVNKPLNEQIIQNLCWAEQYQSDSASKLLNLTLAKQNSS